MYESDRKASPKRTPPPTSDHSGMFPPGKWRDLWAAILFYINFFSVLALAIWSTQNSSQKAFENIPLIDHSVMRNLASIMSIIGASLGSAAVLSMGILVLAHSAPEAAIKASFFSSIAINFLLALFLFVNSSVIAGIVLCVFGGLSLFWLASCWRRIPLSAVILKTSLQVLSLYPATLFVVVGSAIIQTLNFLLVVVCELGVHAIFVEDETVRTALSLYVAFYFLWSVQVISNVAQTTISGVYGAYYFLAGSSGPQLKNPTFKSFKRAITWSFGSICFGSLVVAVIQFLRHLAENSKERKDLSGAIASCLLKILEDIVQYFNYYAYIHIALYGKSYTQAASDVWRLLQRNGIMAIINDDMIGTFCQMASLSIASLCMIVSYVVSSLVFGSSRNIVTGISFLGWLSGALTSTVFLNVVYSGSTTMMVCVAEDPEALHRTKPELYEKLASAYQSIFYNWRYP